MSYRLSMELRPGHVMEWVAIHCDFVKENRMQSCLSKIGIMVLVEEDGYGDGGDGDGGLDVNK